MELDAKVTSYLLNYFQNEELLDLPFRLMYYRLDHIDSTEECVIQLVVAHKSKGLYWTKVLALQNKDKVYELADKTDVLKLKLYKKLGVNLYEKA